MSRTFLERHRRTLQDTLEKLGRWFATPPIWVVLVFRIANWHEAIAVDATPLRLQFSEVLQASRASSSRLAAHAHSDWWW